MVTFWLIISWISSILFAVIGLAMFGMGGRLQAVLFLGIVLLLVPPCRSFMHAITGKTLPWWGRGLLIIVLWGGVMVSFTLNPATSIYKSSDVEAQFMKLYDAKLAEWPLPYDSVFVDTTYGNVHVIVCGPEDAPPLLLLHASGLTAWSWMPNIEVLGQHYRIYAPDHLGEVGKSTLHDVNTPLKGGVAIAELYTELTNKLGLEQSYVAGASIGGFLGTTYALHAPERVKKLVLLGSMGYGETNTTVLGITFAQAFPLKPIQNWAFNWAFGSEPKVRERFSEWFWLVLNGAMPKATMPTSFTADQLRKITVPVLAYFGSKDGVIGDAENAKTLAENIPDVRVEIVESGHMIGVELPDIVNQAMLKFFDE